VAGPHIVRLLDAGIITTKQRATLNHFASGKVPEAADGARKKGVGVLMEIKLDVWVRTQQLERIANGMEIIALKILAGVMIKMKMHVIIKRDASGAPGQALDIAKR